jgi:ubiquinol-cytochrome c reductase iron-sulfur subunit
MSLSYFYLLLVVLGIFIFCYLVATRVWIKVESDKDKKLSKEVDSNDKENRRDFLYLSSITIGGVGAATFMWPFIKSMNPAEDTLALGTTEVDLSAISAGQSITVKWRGKPVFIRKRTQEEIQAANNVEISSLRDPAEDSERVKRPEWLVMEGICTHLGCVPLGQKAIDTKGEYNGWFCPCHGSHYDTSGRIRKGPAPNNLAVPPYIFLNDTRIKIG